MNATFIYGSFSFLGVAAIYLLIKNRLGYIIYSVVIFLVLLQIAGALLRILHLKGGDALLLTGLTGTMLGGVLLIWRSLQNSLHQILFTKLVAGVLLLIQCALFFLPVAQSLKIEPFIAYPVTALIATLLINDQAEHEGEKNMLLLFLFQSIFQIVFNLLRVL
jgi:hypothetical protein